MNADYNKQRSNTELTKNPS